MQDIIPPSKGTTTPKRPDATSTAPNTTAQASRSQPTSTPAASAKSPSSSSDAAAAELIQKKIAEKKAAAEKSDATPSDTSAKPVGGVVKPPLWRRILTSFLVLLCITSSFAFALAVWAKRSILSTPAFVEIFAPLADDAKVQDRITTIVTDKILDSAPIQETAAKLLPGATAGLTDDQLRTGVTPIIKESVANAVKSPQFAVAWRDALGTMHSGVISGLSGNGQPIELNVTPIFNQVLDSFNGTQLGFIAQEQRQQILDSQNTTIRLDDTQRLRDIGTAVNLVKNAHIFALVATILLFLAAIAVSPYRFRTARRIAFLMAVMFVTFGLILLASKQLISSLTPIDMRAFADAATGRLFSGLIAQSLLVGSTLFVVWFAMYILRRTKFSKVA